MAQECLGSGMKFPPQINPATGRFEVVSGQASVKESVYIILMTQKAAITACSCCLATYIMRK